VIRFVDCVVFTLFYPLTVTFVVVTLLLLHVVTCSFTFDTFSRCCPLRCLIYLLLLVLYQLLVPHVVIRTLITVVVPNCYIVCCPAFDVHCCCVVVALLLLPCVDVAVVVVR